MQRLTLADWLLAAVSSVYRSYRRGFGDGHAEYIFTLAARRKCLYTRCKIDVRVCEITKYIRREVPVDHSDIREILLIGKIFSFFFFFLWYLRWSFDDNNAEKLVISFSNIVEEYWNSPCRLIHFPFPYIKIKIKIEIQFYRESIYYIS